MISVKEEIAKNISYYRKKCHLTQRQLAEKIGTKHNSISSWENAINSVDVEMLFNICVVLGITLSEAYGVYANEQNLGVTAKEKVLIECYRELNIEGQYYIDKQLHFAVAQPEYKKDNLFETLQENA